MWITYVHEVVGDVADILRATGRSNVGHQIERLGSQLLDSQMSIHIGYLGDAPASCGRLRYGVTSGFAELAP